MSAPAKAMNVNRAGLERKMYEGGKSTLCQGCGHDSITRHITDAFYQLGVNPYKVAKMSGIGCSSKTTAYFLNPGYGFNSVHGRMPSVSAGASLANRELHVIGVSGDGDTASIGVGQFVHLVRRNTKMVYLIENNGVYGLTKGQFSATADVNATLKTGEKNAFKPIDCCGLAVELGCDFVARAYSGDAKQVVALIKAGISHGGTALIDVISPCVTFNNHEGSTKSYKYVKDHEWVVDQIDYVPAYENPAVEYDEGQTVKVELPDGSHIYLRKLEKDYDPHDRMRALDVLHRAETEGQVVTGLFYINPKTHGHNETLNLAAKPLALMTEADARPPKAALDEVMASLT
jgi:2-oxoglutarate/2-oxoacid ferredoxin oxidoreductase subunit beta